MKLNHLTLPVSDVLATRDFLEKYFNLSRLGGPGTKRMAFLTDENGMVLNIFKAGSDGLPEYPQYFHIGFIQPSRDDVDAINLRLKEDGFEVPEPSHQHGSWTFYFEVPGGFTVEVLS